VTDGFDVIAVGVAHEDPVVVLVILRPQARFVQDLGARGRSGDIEGIHGGAIRAEKATCVSRKPSPVVLGPIQNSGLEGSPNPMTSPKSMTRVPPSGASTAL